MTDVLAPVFVPYARFLEVRARRLDIAAELTHPDPHQTDHAGDGVVVSSLEPVTDDQHARVAVCVRPTRPAAGVQE